MQANILARALMLVNLEPSHNSSIKWVHFASLEINIPEEKDRHRNDPQYSFWCLPFMIGQYHLFWRLGWSWTRTDIGRKQRLYDKAATVHQYLFCAHGGIHSWERECEAWTSDSPENFPLEEAEKAKENHELPFKVIQCEPIPSPGPLLWDNDSDADATCRTKIHPHLKKCNDSSRTLASWLKSLTRVEQPQLACV